MKKIISILTGILFSITIFIAQEAPPQAFSFKALITNRLGNPIANRTVYLQISILRDNSDGLPVYVETFSPTTNEYGQVDMEIGHGTIISGNFSTIEWPEDEYFLKIEYRLRPSNPYTTLSTTQLLSVPYALYSGETGNGFTSVFDETDKRPVLGEDGGIGIGTPANSWYKLSLNGIMAIYPGPNSYWGSTLTLDPSSQPGGVPYLIASCSESSGEGPGKFLIRDDQGNSTFLMDNLGHTGINNLFPEFSLDVNGDINFSGNLLKSGQPYGANNVPPTSSNIGDMLYWSGETWAVVPAGTEGQILTMGPSGQPIWQNKEENPPPGGGLIAYYPFDGNAEDKSGNGHQGIVNGAVLTADRFGDENKAYSFDGTDDYIDIGDWAWGGASTICGWISYTELRWFSRFVDFGSGADSYNVLIHNLEHSATCAVDIHRGSEIRRVSYDNYYDLGEWIFVTFTVSSDGKMKLYKNGALAASNDDGWEIDNTLRTEQFIAKSNYGQDEFFKGKIDDVRIYNRVLSDEEILALYHEGGY